MKTLITIGTIGATLLLAGCLHDDDCKCKDIMYDFDIPTDQADCPADTIFTQSVPGSSDLDGGTGIIDRDGGTGIIDRDNNFITDYCYEECKAGETPTGPTIVKWNDSKNSNVVVADRKCMVGESE